LLDIVVVGCFSSQATFVRDKTTVVVIIAGCMFPAKKQVSLFEVPFSVRYTVYLCNIISLFRPPMCKEAMVLLRFRQTLNYSAQH